MFVLIHFFQGLKLFKECLITGSLQLTSYPSFHLGGPFLFHLCHPCGPLVVLHARLHGNLLYPFHPDLWIHHGRLPNLHGSLQDHLGPRHQLAHRGPCRALRAFPFHLCLCHLQGGRGGHRLTLLVWGLCTGCTPSAMQSSGCHNPCGHKA